MKRAAIKKEFVLSSVRSRMPVRNLTANQLNLPVSAKATTRGSGVQLSTELQDDDPIWIETRRLLDDGYAGIIFTGPPGTSKTWYATQIAVKLVDLDPQRARFLQFHPSYQYEDFIEGYVPDDDGKFMLKPKHLLEMSEIARKFDGKYCVLVIDELSRCDPGRVFGEALTYVEMTKRDQPFSLASGRKVAIPRNLIFLATMNPLDRGVDEVDAALERRFAKIAMPPDRRILIQLLTRNGMDQKLQDALLNFFDAVSVNSNPHCHVGHAYFQGVKDLEGLKRLWRSQLRFHLEKAFRLDPEGFRKVEAVWEKQVIAGQSV